eukprot:6431435-Prymnesium_polylepis.1
MLALRSLLLAPKWGPAERSPGGRGDLIAMTLKRDPHGGRPPHAAPASPRLSELTPSCSR